MDKKAECGLISSVLQLSLTKGAAAISREENVCHLPLRADLIGNMLFPRLCTKVGEFNKLRDLDDEVDAVPLITTFN